MLHSRSSIACIVLACAAFLGIWAVRPPQATGVTANGSADVRGHWEQVASPVSESLRAVDMLSTTSGWAGGINASLLRYAGGIWSKVNAPVIANGISAIEALSETDVWATDYGGRILHYDGVSWQVSAALTSDPLQDIKMLSPTQGWAVGLNRTLLRWDGTKWTAMPKPTGSRPGFYGVLPFSANDIWITVLRGVYHWDGVTWTFHELTSDTTTYGDVLGLSSSDLWAMGTRWGYAWHFDGTSWSNRWSPITAEGADMVSGTDIWVAGGDANFVGGIAHWDGVQWERVPCPAMSGQLFSISMVSADDGWAVGDGGMILHYVPGPALTETPTATATETATATPTATATVSATPGPTSTPTATTTSVTSQRVYLPLILSTGVPPISTPTPMPTVSLTSTPTATPTLAGNGCTFTDTFTDPASGWPILNASSGDHYVYSNGAYDVLTEVYGGQAAQTVLLVNPSTWCDNSRIQVDLRWVTPVWVGRTASEWGVVFRYVDDANYYSFNAVWNGSAGFYILRKRVNGVSTNLTSFVSDRNYYFHPLDANRAYVSTRGSQITVGAVVRGVDTPLVTITDASLQAGYAGFRHYSDTGGVPYSRLNTRLSLFSQAPQP